MELQSAIRLLFCFGLDWIGLVERMKAIYEQRLPCRFSMYSNNFHLCRLQSMAAVNEMNRMCVLINRIDDCDKREKSTTHVYNGRHIFTIEWKRHLNLNRSKHLFIAVVIMSRILHTFFSTAPL